MSSWRLTLRSDRRTAGNAGLVSRFVKFVSSNAAYLLAGSVTANALIADK